MGVESYIEIVDGERRVKGTRVGVAVIADAFNEGSSPEEIARQYPSVTLEQVYATIAYYLAHRDQVDATLEDSEPSPVYEESPVIARLRRLKARRGRAGGDAPASV